MNRSPAAHRLLTKKARQERAYRRALYRMPYRVVLGYEMRDVDSSMAFAQHGVAHRIITKEA